MTASPDPSPPPTPSARWWHGGVMLGIALKVGSVFIFVVMSTLLKAAEGVPPGQLVFYRSFFAIFPIVVFLAWRGQLGEGLVTRRPVGHMFRGVIGVTAMGLSFYALTKLPLPEAIALTYATPLLIVVFSAIFLREQVRLYRWSAVFVGLVGVMIIAWPRLTIFEDGFGLASEQSLGVIAALAGCAAAAVAMLMVRTLVRTERSGTVVIYFSITSSVVALFSIPFGWVWPTPEQTVLLVLAGIAGGIAQILLTECYRHADMSVIAPFDYSSMLLGLVLGYLVFADIPTVEMLIGGAIVMAAGIFIIYREHQLGLERASSKKVSTPQG